MIDKIRCCCFFGHRKIKETEELKETVYNAVEDLIILQDTVAVLPCAIFVLVLYKETDGAAGLLIVIFLVATSLLTHPYRTLIALIV